MSMSFFSFFFLQLNLFIVASVENPDAFHHSHTIHGSGLFSNLNTSMS